MKSEPDDAARAREAQRRAEAAARLGGLCPRCSHVRRVTGASGSVFFLCRRSETDVLYPKYPPQPVVACRGFES